MFIPIQDTDVNQFRTSSASLTRRAKSKQTKVWKINFYACFIIGMILFVHGLIQFLFVQAVTFGTYDDFGRYTAPDYFPGYMTAWVTVFFGIFLAALAFRSDMLAAEIPRLQHKILAGDYRSHFVTPQEYSYGVIFGDSALAVYRASELHSADKRKKIDAFLGHPSIIKADTEIKSASEELEGIEQAYQAKLVVISAAEQLDRITEIGTGDYFSALRAEAAHAFNRRLTAIKNEAQRKLEQAEELEKAHNVAPTPTDR